MNWRLSKTNIARLQKRFVFSLETLEQLPVLLEPKTMKYDLDFSSTHFMTISKALTDLSLAKKTREQTIL